MTKIWGNKNGAWKGDRAKYQAIHMWVRARLPKQDYCSKCSMIKKRLEMANISGEYKRDLNDWQWLCVSCHMDSDGRKSIGVANLIQFRD